MNNKLSNEIIAKISDLTLQEMGDLLNKLNDKYNNDYINTWKYLAKTYTDEQITPLLPSPKIYISEDTRTRDEKLQELRSYYVKSDNINITVNDIPAFKRGRQKKDKTLKDKVFEVLDTNMKNENIELDYKGVLESDILNIAENTFKTILSLWRKEHGIKVKRGRKVKKG